MVRYGNVMGSRGSVLPLFFNQSKNNLFTITDKFMTRFNITLEHGVRFVLESLNEMVGGELFVPKLPSYTILDLAKAVNLKAKIKIIGIRPGEKIHEELITASDSNYTLEFKDKYIILPSFEFFDNKFAAQKYKKYYKKGKKCKIGFTYNSKNNGDFLNLKQIKKLIFNQKY